MWSGISSYSPYHIINYVVWYVRWVWKFDYKGERYGPEEELYLTKKKLNLSAAMWEVG